MKRNTTGIEAYSKMISRELPSKTSTYTPIAHADVISRVRSEILSAGYYITGEDYKTTNDGQVALGTIQLNYKADPDVQLSANFLNSYNKQYAFRFSLGGVVKGAQTSIMLNGDEFGAYKRVHKGAADILAAGKIKEFIMDSGAYWDKLIEDKEILKYNMLHTDHVYTILGRLFFEKGVLNTFQMNIVKTEMNEPEYPQYNNAWTLYNYILTALRETHPADWMEQHQIVHEVMMEETTIRLAPSTLEYSAVYPELPGTLPMSGSTWGHSVNVEASSSGSISASGTTSDTAISTITLADTSTL